MLLFTIKPLSFLLLPIFLLFSSTLCSISHGASSNELLFQTNHIPGTILESENGDVPQGMRRSVLEYYSTVILASQKTRREDPLERFHYYTGGWNISNEHYVSSVAFAGFPLFLISAIWFAGFGLFLLFCLCLGCRRRQRTYGYSQTAYALSLILLSLFTLAAISGCVVLYIGQEKFHNSTVNTLDDVVSKSKSTVESLRDISDYFAAAKQVGIDQVSLPIDIQNNIDGVDKDISAAAATLERATKDNKKKIEYVLNSVRLDLIIIAGVMLILTLLGLLFSVLGLQFLVYILVIFGWILVTSTFALAGVFVVLHDMVGDTCVAMDEWVQNPTAHTALDNILSCVDNVTAQETLSQSKEATYQLVQIVNGVISNASNVNVPPSAPQPLYYNQSGPLVPALCNPFNTDLSNRTCAADEVDFSNASQVWKNYMCDVSITNTCTTVGRLTPIMYNQMTNSANVSYGLYHYGPFLVGLLDCSSVGKTFSGISQDHCPNLKQYSKWVYIGLALASAAVMLSLIFWVICARERRHRRETKLTNAAYGDCDLAGKRPYN